MKLFTVLISFVLIFCFNIKANALKTYSNFSNYFYSESGRPIKRLGIDVSGWDKDVDFKIVKSRGAAFAIIKATQNCPDGAGGREICEDSRFRSNVEKAKRAGIDYGFYHATYARSEEEAHHEAEFLIKSISQYKPFCYPVAIDMEGSYYETKIKNHKKYKDIAVIIAQDLENAGFFPSIYCSVSEQCKYLNYEDRGSHEVGKIDRWIAWWDHFNIDDRDQVFSELPECTMLQYTSAKDKGTIRFWGSQNETGIDLDIAYFDFPRFSKCHHLNGF